MMMEEKKNGTGILITTAVVYFAVIVGLLIFSTFRSHSIMDELLKNEMIEVARSAAISVNGDDLAGIDEGDEDTPEYKRLYDKLTVFLENTEAKYVYAIRSMSPGKYSFILDTDPEDPGMFGEEVEETEATKEALLGLPAVDDKPFQDRWGTFYSAYCPVYSSNGKVAGIICADFPAEWYEKEVSTHLWMIIMLGVSAMVFTVFILLLIRYGARREKTIHEKKKQEFSVARTEVQEATLRRTDFLKMMSHEIRTPINMVMGMDEMILRESVDPDIRENAMKVRRAVIQLLLMVEEAIDISKVEDEQSEPTSVRYDPLLLISDLSDIIHERLDHSDVKFYTEIDDNIPSILMGDSMRIRQALQNLLNNSVRYTNIGEIHFTITREHIRDDDIWIKFSVTDTGVGVPDEAVDRMLNTFSDEYADDELTNGVVELGLSLVNRLLRSMNSRLEYQRNKVGSTFFFILKQTVIDKKPIGSYSKAKETMASQEQSVEHREYTAPDARILVVDDEEMNLMVVNSLLRSTKIQIDATVSGEEALEYMAENDYDVLIFDHLMEEIDGIELLRLVRENRGNQNSTVPCIVMTANTSEGAKEGYLKVGFDAYISKPLSKEYLESLLLRYLPRNKVKFENV